MGTRANYLAVPGLGDEAYRHPKLSRFFFRRANIVVKLSRNSGADEALKHIARVIDSRIVKVLSE